MLRLILLLSVSSMIVGCGQGFRAISPGIVDPEFQPYVDKFMELGNISHMSVDMYFEDQTGYIIGTCLVRGQERRIEIDPAWWWSANNLDREIVIFHELGHCVLNQRHRDNLLFDGCSGSVMNTYHIGSYCYGLHYDYYIQELFSGG